MRVRRVGIMAVALVLLVVAGAVAFSYRYLLLSKLNVDAGGNEAIRLSEY